MSDLSIQWLIVFVDASVKAALVALVAAAVLALLRVRDSNLRHRAWTGVLCGMLLLPVLTQVVPALRLPFAVDLEWFAKLQVVESGQPNGTDGAGKSQLTDLPEGEAASTTAQPVTNEQPVALDDESPVRDDVRFMAGRPAWPGASGRWPGEFHDGPPQSLGGPNSSDTENSADPSTSVAASTPVEAEADVSTPGTVVQPTVAQAILVRMPLIFWSVWLFGAGFLAIRLLAGLWMARVLRRAARPIDPADLPALIIDAKQHADDSCGAGVSPAAGQARRLRHKAGPSARDVPVLACPLIRVPLTLGAFRPQILLPPDWTDWSAEKLQVILIHERTHAQRGDYALALLAEVNRCLYWFHPLAWWLRRRLASLAEAACDDAAIGSTGDRASYARHLLEVAATARAHHGRLVTGGVSMARCSSVETRIDSILDSTRPLSQRLTRGTVLALVAVIVPLIALAAALRPSTGKEEAQSNVVAESAETMDLGDVRIAMDKADMTPSLDPPVDVGKKDAPRAAESTEYSVLSTQSPAPNEPASSPNSDVTFTFAGTVVGPDGKSVSGAKVSLSYFHKSPLASNVAGVPAAVTDNQGKFELSFKAGDANDAAFSGSGFWTDTGLVAVKDGYGFAFAPAVHFETSGRADSELTEWQREQLARRPLTKPKVLTLVRDDLPIRGRILNADGRPVAGALVEPFTFGEGQDGTLDAWEAAAKEQEASTATTSRFMREIARAHRVNFIFRGGMGSAPATRMTMQGNLFAGSRPPIVPAVRTGADGWFTLQGMGRERIVELLISGPGIETSEQFVRTRAGEVVKLGLHKPIPHAALAFVYHPQEFTLVSGPSIPVTGRVTDFKTGQPLAGVGVQSTGHWKGVVTDAEGKYHLEGLPLGTTDLLITPPARSRHLAGGVHLTTTAAAPAFVRDISLTPGVLVRGRVVDETTGKPVRGSLQYFAYKTNPHATGSDSLQQGNTHIEFHPDADGRFEIPVLPGQGILALSAGTEFPDAVGADGIDCPRLGTERNSIVFVTAPTFCNASSHNLLIPINLRQEDDELMVNLALRSSGVNVQGRVLAPDGQPLDNYRIFGARRHVVWPVNPGKSFKVERYIPSETRRIIVYHEERNLVGYYDLTGEPPENLEITLQPAATIVGRVLDADGAAAFKQVNIISQLDMALLNGKPSTADLAYGVFQMNVKTDSNGRFELKGIVPGLKYTAHLNFFPPFPTEKSLKTSLQGPIFIDVTAEAGETKDLGDLVLELDSGKTATPVKSEKPAAKPTLDPPANGGKNDTPSADGGKTNSPSPSTGRAGVGATADGDTVTVTGIVLKPDGKPAAGATIRAAAPLWAMMAPIVGSDFKSPMSETKSDTQGKFAISFPTQPFGDVSRLDERWREIWKKTTIAASLPGFGPAWATYEETDPNQPVTLRLIDDVPIRGRIVNLEGQPVAGATIKLGEPRAAKGDDLSAWIEGVKAGELPWTVVDKAPRFVELRVLGLPDLLTTDASGAFEIRGIGRERCLPLTFEGEFVAHRDATAVTRIMPTLQRKISNPPFEGFEPVFGADFTFTAEPARAIEGIVRDAKNGEALAGVSVESYKLVGYPYSNNRVLKSTTDKLGRFRLIGMPKGSGNRLLLLPNDDQPYFMREVEVPDPVGLEPAKMEIDLHQGIWIGGRVTDKATGEPVSAVKMYYLPFLSNEYAQRTPEFRADENVDGDQWRYVTKPDGTYRLVGLPGRAIIGADSTLKPFRRGIGYDAIDAPKSNGWFQTYRNPVNPGPTWPTMMREINPAADAADVTLDFELDPGKSVKIHVVDREGRPVTGVGATGVSTGGSVKASQQSVVIAQNFGPRESRTVLLRHKQRKIGRVLTITPEMVDQGEISIELQPVSIVTGQLRRSEGGPVSGMEIEPRILPAGVSDAESGGATTNAEGQFQIELLPGCRYALDGRGGGFSYVNLIDELAVEPGETKDLGTLVLGDDGKLVKPKKAPATGSAPATQPPLDPPANGGRDKSPSADAGKKDAASGNAKPSTKYSVLSAQSGDIALAIHGRVLGPDGNPAAKAHVAVIGSKIQPERGGDLTSRSDVMAEAIADDNGRFVTKLSGVSSKTHSQAHLIARLDGFGLAWQRIDPDARDIDVSLDLPAEQVIRGRLIDIEGRPAGAVRLSINSLSLRAGAASSIERIGYYEFANVPQAWPPLITTDQDGRFAIHGIPADNGVHLSVTGNDRFAPQGVALNTGAPEQRPESDATYRSLVRNLKPGEEGVLPLAPAQIFEGVVKFEDTGAPAPHARLTIFASQQEGAGSWFGLAGTADEQGRYRINPHPGVRFMITAYPPDGAPYLVRKTRDIKHKEETLVKRVDVALPRGVLVRGRILEAGTKAPVAGAMIQYVPERRNNRRATEDIITGHEGVQLSGTDGAFEIAVLAGPGNLLVNGPGGQFVFQEFGSRLLDRGTPGGDRNYAHAIQRVNPEPNADPLDLTFELQRGGTVNIRLTNAAQEPVEHALVVSRLFVNPAELHWRGFPKEALGERFELSGLGEGMEYSVHFLDAKNRLGTTVVIKAGDDSPTVVLTPCGESVGTFVDGKGQSVQGQPLQLVVAPGPQRFAVPPDAPGELTADTAFYSNIDRKHPGPKLDAEGRTTFTGLIPGARYRILDWDNGRAIVVTEFVAESGKTVDLGKITMTTRKEE